MRVASSTGIAARTVWSSEDLVETFPAHLVSRFELFGARPSEMAMASGAIVERIDVVGHVRDRELAVLVDLSFDCSYLKLLKNDSATALSQQLPFLVILGSRRFERQNRRHASLPNWVP